MAETKCRAKGAVIYGPTILVQVDVCEDNEFPRENT